MQSFHLLVCLYINRIIVVRFVLFCFSLSLSLSVHAVMWSFSRCWFGYQKLTPHPHHHHAFSNGCFVRLLDNVLLAILLHYDWIIILRNVFFPEKSKNTSRGGHQPFFLFLLSNLSLAGVVVDKIVHCIFLETSICNFSYHE